MMDINSFVGIPWIKGESSFKGADCWGLVLLFFRENYDITIKDYHDFQPTGSTEGCVHTTTFDDGNQSRYFRWMKDGVWFELTSFNYNISDDDALKFANSIQEQINQSN